MIHRPNLYYSKMSKRKLKKEWTISSGTGKNTTSWTLSSSLHLEGQTRYFTTVNCCFGHTHTIKLIKIKWIQSLLNPTNALWKDLMLHWLKLILNSDQDLAFFLTKTDSYRSISHKKLQKQNDEDFSIQLLYAWLYLPYIYRRNSCPTHIFNPKH